MNSDTQHIAEAQPISCTSRKKC